MKNKDVIFLSVKVNGKNKKGLYTSEWVNKLFSMIKRNCTCKNIGFCCLTDNPKGLRKDIQAIPIEHNPALHGWWAKIKLFNPDLPFRNGQRLIYSDLDNLIVSNIDEIVQFPAKFALTSITAPNFKPKGVITCYNSSFMAWNHGEKSEIYTEFNNSVPTKLRSDQDWMAYILGKNETVMPSNWFQRLGLCSEKGPEQTTKVVFCIKPKNHIAAKEIEWVRKIWQ